MMCKPTQRIFGIGSEWLYYKIYTGHKTSDRILTSLILPTITRLKSQQIIDKWFFIRYADPKHHLRIRFHTTKKKGLGKIIDDLHVSLKDFLREEQIWKIQIETYQRELERYGDLTMALSESVFYIDSESIVEFLDLIDGDVGEELRWLFGLRSIDDLLNTFKYNMEGKLHLLDVLKTGFGKEFGMSRPLKKQLDDKFREKRKKIEHFLHFTEIEEPDSISILENLKRKNRKLEPIAGQIIEIVSTNTNVTLMNNLLSSYIHMLMNRLFKSKNRLNEMVCYDFLYRYYRSQISRNNRKS